MALYTDLRGLPVIAVMGLVLGAGILVAMQKLPGLRQKKSATKRGRKGKVKKKTSDKVSSEENVE